MENHEYQLLRHHLTAMLQNKPLTEEEIQPISSQMDELQQGLRYLSSCIMEMGQYATNICNGDLDAPRPARHNYLVGSLKELHSVLQHLTWQTKQVATGDYNQRVSFLGDFSTSFNTMVKQLEEREVALTQSKVELEQSIDLLKSIMDVSKDWIMVVTTESGDVMYNNCAATRPLKTFSIEDLQFEEISVLEGNENLGTTTTTTYLCHTDDHYYAVNSYPVNHNGQHAMVHYISDITQQQLNYKRLSEMAYTDSLTDAYNRRYCMLEIQHLRDGKVPFSLVTIDLNGLKYANDHFGHEAGDQYIVFVVSTIRAFIRESDVVCRVGGDEFVVLLKKCPEEIALHKMHQLHLHVEADTTCPVPTSISFGVVYVGEDETATTDVLLNRSDERMYQFKQAYKASHPQPSDNGNG